MRALTDYSIIAHQGGWDEILMVAGPLAVVGGLMYLATKRLSKKVQESQQPANESQLSVMKD